MDVTDHDPYLVPVLAPAPPRELLQGDEMDIHLVTRSVEDHTVVGVHQAVMFTDQAALSHVLVRLHSDVGLQTDLHRPEGVLQAILEEAMAVVDLEATLFAPVVPPHDLSLVHARAPCHTQATRDILEVAAVPDQSAGQGEAAVAMTSGIVDLDHPKLDDMVYPSRFTMSSLYIIRIFKNIYDTSGM